MTNLLFGWFMSSGRAPDAGFISAKNITKHTVCIAIALIGTMPAAAFTSLNFLPIAQPKVNSLLPSALLVPTNVLSEAESDVLKKAEVVHFLKNAQTCYSVVCMDQNNN